eukprot:GHRR01036625.1.p1 GENE.GHRR01036625.1~~GHRR01036625.1.p1  ORF type:complete len:333 (+),score=114.77 GHRR01036625.1:148-999(+)
MQAAGGVGANPEGTVESHKLVRALRAMRENPQIKAVVLRINSPGGSAVASDMIAREVELLKQAKKPVVACMGDVAASGGYYIAAPASKILAQPGTITGSIGVITARIKVKEALKEYGISGETIKAGENADWASGFHDLTPKQHHQVESMLDETYGNFLAQVARGRGMSLEQVRAVAKGKVWLGSQAVKVGLVDELGGVNRAIEVAKHLAGLPQDVQMLEWPPRCADAVPGLGGGATRPCLIHPATVHVDKMKRTHISVLNVKEGFWDRARLWKLVALIMGFHG